MTVNLSISTECSSQVPINVMKINSNYVTTQYWIWKYQCFYWVDDTANRALNCAILCISAANKALFRSKVLSNVRM